MKTRNASRHALAGGLKALQNFGKAFSEKTVSYDMQPCATNNTNRK